METQVFFQPNQPLGEEIKNLIDSNSNFSRIIFVSAFTSLRTILRFKSKLLSAKNNGSVLRLVLGIDLGGTSKEVLEELLNWNCDVLIFYNPIPRSTFHPKIYMFEGPNNSTIYIGSNNLTDGGMYTNYEAYLKLKFDLPQDQSDYQLFLDQIESVIMATGPTVQSLSQGLIQNLTARGLLPSEAARIQKNRQNRQKLSRANTGNTNSPSLPFLPVPIPSPPLLPKSLRERTQRGTPPQAQIPTPPSSSPIPVSATTRPAGGLVWKKKLSNSDALQVSGNTNPVGGVRLVQAKFKNPIGNIIDQTTYFRQLFDSYDWHSETQRGVSKEIAHVPMRLTIRNNDYGVREFKISHKPSGEAGQGNYTTELHWGRDFSNTIISESLAGTFFYLYETTNADVRFFIEILDR